MGNNTTIPYCPLMSAGNDMAVICSQERCAWFLKGTKTCSVYVLAHKAALDIKKQTMDNK